jgi:hypothetical protein
MEFTVAAGNLIFPTKLSSTSLGNHYHMLLEMPEPNLLAGMRWLQGSYTQRFNARHKECGHLFQRRYKALPVGRDGVYFSSAEYIHLNPARVKGFDFEKKKAGRSCVEQLSSICNGNASGRSGYVSTIF